MVTGAVVVGALAGALAMAGQPPASAQDTSEPPLVSQAQFDGWLTELSNWGRWGPADELGMFNLITPGQARRRAALVSEGFTVSLSSNAQNYESADVPCPMEWSMVRATRTGASDEIAYPCIHAPAPPTSDAFAHVFFDGKMWNGYDVDGLVTMEDGALKNSIMTMKNGIVTRGVPVRHRAPEGGAVAGAGDAHHGRGPGGLGRDGRRPGRSRRCVPYSLGALGPPGRPRAVRHRPRGGGPRQHRDSRG